MVTTIVRLSSHDSDLFLTTLSGSIQGPSIERLADRHARHGLSRHLRRNHYSTDVQD